MDEGENPYKILCVGKDATTQEIKVAYRKLALKHHPDRVSDPALKEKEQRKFAKIANAYEILSDEGNRRDYDRQEKEGLQGTTTKKGGFQPDFPFNDPYEVFKRDFRDQFGMEYPGAAYDFDEVEPKKKKDLPMLTNGKTSSRTASTPSSRFNPFRRNKQDDQPSQAEDNKQSQSNSRALVVKPETSTDLVETRGNNRPISMETTTTSKMVNGKKQTTAKTIITRPDGSTEECVQVTGLPGPGKKKPLMIEGQKNPKMIEGQKQKHVPRLTNGKKKKQQQQQQQQQQQLVLRDQPEQARPSKPKRGLLGWK